MIGVKLVELRYDLVNIQWVRNYSLVPNQLLIVSNVLSANYAKQIIFSSDL